MDTLTALHGSDGALDFAVASGDLPFFWWLAQLAALPLNSAAPIAKPETTERKAIWPDRFLKYCLRRFQTQGRIPAQLRAKRL